VPEEVRILLAIVGALAIALGIAPGLIWLERRLLALWQDRYGPNRVGPFGLLQVVADSIKMFMKEDWVPSFAAKSVFVLAPTIVLIIALMGFLVMPFAPGFVVSRIDIGLLFVLGMLSLGVYSIVLAGWASNSKYSLIGGLRAVAQMLSYEVFMGLSVMGVVIQAGSFDLVAIVEAQRPLWFCVPQALGLALFAMGGIAVIHRLPFDLPEADAELVAGYHVEYSGMKFGMFFVGEYVGMVLIGGMITTLYLGGWHGPALTPVAWLCGADFARELGPLVWFLLKTVVVIAAFILVRAALPRPRYDQLVKFAWTALFPLSLVNLLVTGGVVLATR
jgi:NADH-quinone oxidoreductase subunit H